MKEINWKTKDGRNVKVVVTFVEKDERNVDGYKMELTVNEINVHAYVNGQLVGVGVPMPTNHPIAVASIGKLGLTKENYDRVMNAINELSPKPEKFDYDNGESVINAMTLNGTSY